MDLTIVKKDVSSMYLKYVSLLTSSLALLQKRNKRSAKLFAPLSNCY